MAKNQSQSPVHFEVLAILGTFFFNITQVQIHTFRSVGKVSEK